MEMDLLQMKTEFQHGEEHVAKGQQQLDSLQKRVQHQNEHKPSSRTNGNEVQTNGQETLAKSREKFGATQHLEKRPDEIQHQQKQKV
jgi:hypothetical protein